MRLFSLNDDVLLAIFANLHGEDALKVSLTSKRAYALAGPRIASRINCSSPGQLRRLHAYLLSVLPDGRPRARFMEYLVIETSTFENAENNLGDAAYYYGGDFSQAALLGDILLQAPNLRELFLEHFQSCLERDPRIGDAIRSLTGLVNLRLLTVSDSSLSVFESFRSDRLACLTLYYYVLDDFPLENGSKTLPPLILLLSSLHHLRIVELWSFDSTAESPSLARAEAPAIPTPSQSFPLIRYLRLSQSSVPALDLVELCPALSTLIVSFSWYAEPLALRAGPQWPPLRRLMVANLDDVRRFSARLRTLDGLMPVSVEDYSWLSELPTALSALPLVCLRLLVPDEQQRRWSQGFTSKGEGLAQLRQQEIDRLLTLGEGTDVDVDASVAALSVKEDDVVWEWDELRHLFVVRKQCWWRIVDGPRGRELVEIKEAEGEGAQRHIEAGAVDSAYLEGALASLHYDLAWMVTYWNSTPARRLVCYHE
ncbi:hypothetical protein C8T65DRAFT_828540 [Cerioporus squamosus]|nr:hypothetical protein C8T65DRAFT_828540 [Cerioporus squamosus]